MGKLAKIISFVRNIRYGGTISDVKVNAGGKNIITAEHYSSAGDDSRPLPDDFAILVEAGRTGNTVAVGYLDVTTTPVAGKGEKRIYSRNSNGDVSASIHLKNDDSVKIENLLGYIELRADGVVDINGFLITPNADASGNSVSAPSIVANGKELAGHLHGGVETGAGQTGPNI